MPLVVLAAKRASNSGKNVIVVTSNESSDDELTSVLHENEIAFFRGSLNNTLERFVDALSSYPDDTIVFRLTGDNVFPDGSLLDEMEARFKADKLNYLVCIGKESGLPYGTTAEVTTASCIREAHSHAKNDEDFEHVTPFIKRKYGESFFKTYSNLNCSDLRSTVDVVDDYMRVRSVFDEVNDPINISFLQLVEKLKRVDC